MGQISHFHFPQSVLPEEVDEDSADVAINLEFDQEQDDEEFGGGEEDEEGGGVGGGVDGQRLDVVQEEEGEGGGGEGEVWCGVVWCGVVW
jgi:hypothetical protein